MTKYAAFLRGINVGGHKTIRMAAVRQAFESLGLEKVRTLLASGNVLFETPATDARALTRSLEQKIKKTVGLEVSVILRTRRSLQLLLNANPFKGMKVTPRTRLFVTFLSVKPATSLKIPYKSPDKSFRILRLTHREVCSVLTLGPQWAKNLHQMDILEKEFGKRITTRSWSTVARVLKPAP